VGLVVRAAEPTDSDVIEALIFGEPSSEAAALAGGPERARIFGHLVMGASPFASWQATKVAELDGQIVAALQQGPAEEDFRPTLRFLWAVARGFGLRASLALLPRGLALQRARLAAPAGAWVVREVHVDPSSRNRGIGRVLLEQAEADASRRGATTMALTTRTNNPARRLYERLGYRVIDTRTDRRYKKWTGAEGACSWSKS
jgi:ribosomal protein S18 acetylase RimI-like enzyme